MPSDRLGGRFALALYQMLDYGFEGAGVNADSHGNGNQRDVNFDEEAQHHASNPSSADSTSALQRGKSFGRLSNQGSIFQASSSSSTTLQAQPRPSRVMNAATTSANVVHSTATTHLVVASVSEYIASALAITHKPKLREAHVNEISKRREKLFGDIAQHERTKKEWKSFVEMVLKDRK